MTAPIVTNWSAAEVRALRTARRMSVREFAQHLGVSHRIVSKWEAATAVPSPVNQAALDTSLARTEPREYHRFAALLRPDSAGDGPRSSVTLRADHGFLGPGAELISYVPRVAESAPDLPRNA